MTTPGHGPESEPVEEAATPKPTIGRESSSAEVQNVDLGETADEQPAPEAELLEAEAAPEEPEEPDFEGPRRRARRNARSVAPRRLARQRSRKPAGTPSGAFALSSPMHRNR